MTTKWRYIHYADGSEELYARGDDPEEFKNLASDAAYKEVVEDLRKWIPVDDAEPAPGSKSRLLIEKDGQWIWEGKPIDPSEKIE